MKAAHWALGGHSGGGLQAKLRRPRRAAVQLGVWAWSPVPRASAARFLPTAAKIAGLYNDSEPPRKTMRRGVLMTLLQQSAMTLPLWIGKPGDK